jgi:4-amino-4-deoxy-L-arabinose transferase-like glycosyltransferase
VPSPHSIRRDLLILGALCAVLYGLGLTTHGLTNWQEAQRALVAREMQDRHHWLVPTINDHPYLAKPPLFYWTQIAIADALGRRTGEFELRLTVALAGALGVIATYFLALLIFAPDPSPLFAPNTAPTIPGGLPRRAALLSALFLATGILYTRSSRIGELDILLVPAVTLAAIGILLSWRTHRIRNKAHWPGIILATIAATIASMTKGPPGLAMIALGPYGGIALWSAFTRDLGCHGRDSRLWAVLTYILALAFAITTLIFALPNLESPSNIPGLLLLILMTVALGVVIACLCQPQRFIALLRALSHTHPLIVLGVPLLVFWLWAHTVALRIGPDLACAAATEEVEDNLRLLVPTAPITNLEALAYGAGLGSLGAILALIWLIKDKPLMRPTWWVTIAWTTLGLILFSLASKGVPRYLTPVWPGACLLAGLFFSARLAESRRPARLRAALIAGILLLFTFLTWWYADGRERLHPDRSPRALISQLLRTEYSVDPARLATFEFRQPAIDFYAGHPVRPIGDDIGMRSGMAGIDTWTLRDLRADLARTHEPMTILIRSPRPDARHAPATQTPMERLTLAGLVVETIPVDAPFTIDSGRSPVVAVRVGLAPQN